MGDAPLERGDLDERAFEPQVAPQVMTVDDGVEIEVTAGLHDRRLVEQHYRGFVEPALSLTWTPLSFVALAPTIEPGSERALPVIFSYALGPLSWESELAYHLIVDDSDEWTFDHTLSLDIAWGLAIYGAASTTAEPTLAEIETLFHAGASFAPNERFSMFVSVGQGVRDHAFAMEERVGLLAFRALL